uniref:Uncharacterized protein n=1 Tax=Leersia perrieri TaxID=77586 RepID=A0A0D9VN08_9ORYZ
MARAGGHGMGNPVNVGIAVQADWENREFISNISLNVRRLFDFLLRFEATTKSKLASLNEKLDILERKLEVLEKETGLSLPALCLSSDLTNGRAVGKLEPTARFSSLGNWDPSSSCCCFYLPFVVDLLLAVLISFRFKLYFDGRPKLTSFRLTAAVAMTMNMVASSSIQQPQIHISQRTAGRSVCKLQVAAMSGSRRRRTLGAIRAVSDGGGGGESTSNNDKEEKRRREELERLVGRPEDATFSGADLAALIRGKYGRSYDVTLIRKEFMGRSLLAMNVMWKYREQRSFPLTEEEYLLRLDDVAASLRCWGAVAHVRSSLAKLKDRPRIGKAVSIFIDMPTDDSGARSNEWIYK